jgi:hypothetical protein
MGLFGTIATAIKADMTPITGIGVVMDNAPMPPLVEDWAEFMDAFTATIDGATVVRAWTVGFAGSKALNARIAAGSLKQMREVRYVIRGYLGRQHPNSEATFRDLIEDVLSALDADLGLGGTVLFHDPVEVDLPGPADAVLLGDVLCHFCEMTLVARVEVTLPAA